MTTRLLFVGRRQGALAAATRLGADVFVLHDAPAGKPRANVRGFAQVDFADTAGCVAAARRLLGGQPPDAVVALIERAVLPAAAIREAYGVRGAGVDRARMWRDKVAMKARVRAAGLKTAEHVAVDRKSDADALVGALGLPVVLKPRDASGGRGLVLAHDREEVRAALADGWMAERFVHGVELSVESLVQHGRVLFENVTEYLRPGWANLVPASLPERVDAAVRRLNRAAIEALEVEDGLTHLEAFVTNGDADGEPSIVFGELACRPPGGSLMELLQRAYGFDPWQSHLELELGRPTVPPGPPRRTAGVWFLHPGEGRVVAIEGLESARAVPGIATVECSLELGQLVAARRGVGEHTGRIVSEAGTRDEAARALETARALIRLETEPVAGPHP